MPLNPKLVLDAAIELLDEIGLDELSTRRLATKLGVRVGALYWHFTSKQALLDAIAERMLGNARDAVCWDGDWAEQLTAFAHAVRDTQLAHPDGARILATMSVPGPVAMALIGRPIETLVDAGLGAEAAASGVDVVTSYVNGYTIEEQARKSDMPRKERDTGFTDGLAVIIAGLRSQL